MADWYAVGALASAGVAAVTLGLSLRSFRDQQKESVKPVLWMRIEESEDVNALRLKNYGVGPAIIKSARFTMPDRPANADRIADLFEESPYVEVSTRISAGLAVPAEGEVILMRISLDHVKGQDIGDVEGRRIIRQLREQWAGLHLWIEYTDIYGNPIAPYEKTMGPPTTRLTYREPDLAEPKTETR